MRLCASLVLASLLLATPCSPLAGQASDSLQAVLANGYRFAYTTTGAGRPVLLVHGALADYRFWDEFRMGATDSVQWIAISRRYHAPNPWRPDDPPYGYETSAADLAAVIRALHLPRLVLVGYGWGGGIVLQTALRYPELVDGLVLAEPIADSMIVDDALRARTAERVRQAYANALAGDDERNQETALRSFVAAQFGTTYWEGLPERERQRLRENAQTLRSSAAPQPPVTCIALSHLSLPTLLVGGDASEERFSSTLDGLARCLPQAQRATIAGADHRFPRTHPDEFRRIIDAFVAALPR